jgi:hypothetical protein
LPPVQPKPLAKGYFEAVRTGGEIKKKKTRLQLFRENNSIFFLFVIPLLSPSILSFMNTLTIALLHA